MLNSILNSFDTMIFNGVKNISVGIIAIMSTVSVIDFLLSYIYEFSEDFSGVMRTFFKKIISYAFFFGIAINYKFFIEIFRKAFINIGYLFYEGSSGGSSLPDLDNIYETLKVSAWKILKVSESLRGLKNIGNKLAMYLIFLLAMIFVFIIIKEILLKFIEFQVITGLAIIFLPFNMFEQTKSIGQKLWNGILMSGTRLMLVLALTGMGLTVLRDNPIEISPDTVEFTNILVWVFILGIIAMMIASSSGLASLLVSGSGEGMSASSLGAMLAKGVTTVGLSAVGAGGVIGGLAGAGTGFAKGIATGLSGGNLTPAGLTKTLGNSISSAVKGAKAGAKYGINNTVSKKAKNIATTISNATNIATGNQSFGTLRAGVDRSKSSEFKDFLAGTVGTEASEKWQSMKDNINDTLKANTESIKEHFADTVSSGIDEFVNEGGSKDILTGINSAGTKMLNNFFNKNNFKDLKKENISKFKGNSFKQRDMKIRPYAYDQDFINSIKNS